MPLDSSTLLRMTTSWMQVLVTLEFVPCELPPDHTMNIFDEFVVRKHAEPNLTSIFARP